MLFIFLALVYSVYCAPYMQYIEQEGTNYGLEIIHTRYAFSGYAFAGTGPSNFDNALIGTLDSNGVRASHANTQLTLNQ